MTTDELVRAWNERGTEDDRLQDFFEREIAGREIASSDVPDGVYFLHPEGSCWVAGKFRGGDLVDQTQESDADTHQAACDSWAGVVPSDDDTEITGDVAVAIIRAVMGEYVDTDMVVVAKA